MNASTCTGYVVTQQHMIIPLHFSLFLFKAIEGKKIEFVVLLLKRKFHSSYADTYVSGLSIYM